MSGASRDGFGGCGPGNVRLPTDRRGAAAQHPGMKTYPTSIPEFYANWMAIGWTMLLGRAPEDPTKTPSPKPAQVAAEHEWEGEGGSLKAPQP